MGTKEREVNYMYYVELRIKIGNILYITERCRTWDTDRKILQKFLQDLDNAVASNEIDDFDLISDISPIGKKSLQIIQKYGLN